MRVGRSWRLVQSHTHTLHRLYGCTFVFFYADSLLNYGRRGRRIKRCSARKTRHFFCPLGNAVSHAVVAAATAAVATLRPGATAYRLLSAGNGEVEKRTVKRRLMERSLRSICLDNAQQDRSLPRLGWGCMCLLSYGRDGSHWRGWRQMRYSIQTAFIYTVYGIVSIQSLPRVQISVAPKLILFALRF